MPEPQVEKADLYALKSYINLHYNPIPSGSVINLPGQTPTHFSLRELYKIDSFGITSVTELGNIPSFKIRRDIGNIFSSNSYDVLTFIYFNNAISAQLGEIKDKLDAEMVKDLHKVLSEKTYGGLISNLDELVLSE